MRAFILAGGFATRLWPLTEHRAKPLLPLAGQPLLSHIVAGLPADMHITVSTNEAFAEGFEEWKKTQHKKIDILIERTQSDDQKLGALGAVAQWITQQNIEEDVLLLTGDNYFGCKMETFLARYNPGHPLLAAYDIGSLEKAKSFGTVIVAEDTKTIAAFEEKPKEPKTTLVSTGASVIPADCLKHLVAFAAKKPDNVGGVFEEFLRLEIAVDCFTFAEPWFDIGSFEAYVDATRTLVGDKLLAEDATVENTKREGSAVVGKNSIIKDCVLTDVVVFEDCIIEDCVLERCVIDKDCRLKGVDLIGQMIRAGTHLERVLPA